MQSKVKDVTVLVIGESGVGKSQAGCAFLQRYNAFVTNSGPNSCTFITSEQNNIINGVTRHYIDTQGLLSPEDQDAQHIKQMVEFLKNWNLGINAFYIVINVQNPKFNLIIQRMIQLINDFFNEPSFWNQTGIIFTRCYENSFDRNIAETKYRSLIYNFIKNLPNCQNINPQLPCFFIDSTKWETQESTQNELIKIFQFAYKFDPVPTQKVQITRPEYQKKEREVLEKQLVGIDYQGEGSEKTKIFHYEDQERYKITFWDNNISYTQYQAFRKWNEYKKSIVQHETKTETTEKPFSVCYCHMRYYRSTIEYVRDVIIDPDGNVSRGEWKQKHEIRESRIKQKVPPFDDWLKNREEFWY